MNFNGYLKALMQSLLMISVSGVLAILWDSWWPSSSFIPKRTD